MRIVAVGAALALLTAIAGCGSPPPDAPPATATSGSAAPTGIDPVRIKRIRAELPDGYEVAEVAADADLAGLAGYRRGWTADPADCAALLGPAEPTATRGLSASGAAGTVYVTVTPDSGEPPAEPEEPGACADWTMAYQHSTARVAPGVAPHIDGAVTAGLRAGSVTAVESAAHTESTIRWLTAIPTAQPDGYLVAVTVITTPGTAEGPLTDDYAAGLLVAAVAVLHR